MCTHPKPYNCLDGAYGCGSKTESFCGHSTLTPPRLGLKEEGLQKTWLYRRLDWMRFEGRLSERVFDPKSFQTPLIQALGGKKQASSSFQRKILRLRLFERLLKNSRNFAPKPNATLRGLFRNDDRVCNAVLSRSRGQASRP